MFARFLLSTVLIMIYCRRTETLLRITKVNPNEILPDKGINVLHLAAGINPEDYSKRISEIIIAHGGNPNQRYYWYFHNEYNGYFLHKLDYLVTFYKNAGYMRFFTFVTNPKNCACNFLNCFWIDGSNEIHYPMN